MKKGEKLLLCLGAVLVAAGIGVGVTLGWDYPDNDYHTLDITADDPLTGDFSAVTVSLDSLDIRISSSESSTLSFQTDGFPADRLEITQSGGSIHISEKRTSFLNRITASDYTEFSIYVPQSWIGTLDISTESGDVHCSGLCNTAASVTLSTSFGGISAHDTRLPELHIRSVSGDISLSAQRGGAVFAETTSGYLWCGDAKIDAAQLSSVSGNIELDNTEIAETLTLHTTSGKMELNDVSAQTVSADSTSGELELDEVDTWDLSFSSTSGDLSGELLHARDFSVSFSTVSGDISGIHNTAGGARKLTVKTVSGSIDLDD